VLRLNAQGGFALHGNDLAGRNFAVLIFPNLSPHQKRFAVSPKCRVPIAARTLPNGAPRIVFGPVQKLRKKAHGFFFLGFLA
jgi:hypothetical protein